MCQPLASPVSIVYQVPVLPADANLPSGVTIPFRYVQIPIKNFIGTNNGIFHIVVTRGEDYSQDGAYGSMMLNNSGVIMSIIPQVQSDLIDIDIFGASFNLIFDSIPLPAIYATSSPIIPNLQTSFPGGQYYISVENTTGVVACISFATDLVAWTETPPFAPPFINTELKFVASVGLVVTCTRANLTQSSYTMVPAPGATICYFWDNGQFILYDTENNIGGGASPDDPNNPTPIFMQVIEYGNVPVSNFINQGDLQIILPNGAGFGSPTNPPTPPYYNVIVSQLQ